jgi:hypothetical protein
LKAKENSPIETNIAEFELLHDPYKDVFTLKMNPPALKIIELFLEKYYEIFEGKKISAQDSELLS